MSFRANEMLKQIIRNAGGEANLGPGVKEELRRLLPNAKIVMGRAKRGIYAGRHIRFGDQVSDDGGNKTRRNWKPNVQLKRLFSYIHDRHVRVHVTTHALRCIDRAGGFDEYFLNTPYIKMDTELGLLWKSKIEKMYKEHGKMNVKLFSAEDEAKLVEQFKEANLSETEARKQARKSFYFWSSKSENGKEEEKDENSADQTHKEGDSHGSSPEQMVAGA